MIMKLGALLHVLGKSVLIQPSRSAHDVDEPVSDMNCREHASSWRLWPIIQTCKQISCLLQALLRQSCIASLVSISQLSSQRPELQFGWALGRCVECERCGESRGDNQCAKHDCDLRMGCGHCRLNEG